LENLGLEAVAEAFLLHLQVVCGLEVDPEPIRGPEVARKPEGGVGRDGSKAVHDLIDPAWRYADVLRQAVLTQPHGLQELLEQDLAGVYRREYFRRKFFRRHPSLLMVVHNLNVVCIPRAPAKADSPLIVDANAVLSLSVSLELFQVISWRDSEVTEG
jgi:hypothetical protein